MVRLIWLCLKNFLKGEEELLVAQGHRQTYQNKGQQGRAWPGLKMAAFHRPLYKVSFHLGGSRGLGFWFRGLKLPFLKGEEELLVAQGHRQTYQNKGQQGGAWPGLKMTAFHRPLYKVSFHLGGSRGLGFWFRGLKPTRIALSWLWMHLATQTHKDNNLFTSI